MSSTGTQTCDQDNFGDHTHSHLLDIMADEPDEIDGDFDENDYSDVGSDEAWIPEQPDDKVYQATGDDDDSQENNKTKYVTSNICIVTARLITD